MYKITNIPLFGIYRDARMDSAALEVLHSGQIAAGAYVQQFADGFGKLVNQAHVVTVNDMSSAIQIALRIIGVGPGDEVLASPFACMSTNAPIATSGATAVWVDIDPRTGTLDPDALERAITPRSKAVIVYHLAGYPADLRRIAAICQQRGLKLIEDCDNALLATVDGKQVGCFGDFAVYSFYPNRQINATEGGALCCRLAEDAERALRLRRYGIDVTRFRDKNGEIDAGCDIPEVGWAATLNNLCSAIGCSQLSDTANRINRAREVAGLYDAQMCCLEGIQTVEPLAGSVPAYWTYLIRVQNRDSVLAKLKQRGVQASKLHCRTDLYSGFNTPPVYLPHAQEFLEHVLALPSGWWMDDNDVMLVLKILTDIIKEL